MRETENLWANNPHWPLRTVAAVRCISCRRIAIHTVKLLPRPHAEDCSCILQVSADNPTG